MIAKVFDRTVVSSGAMPTASFGISKKRTAHVMTILRDTLYADPIAAVIREYGANAWDSHRSSGKADVPIQVTVPTYANPVLEIRDFGKGISHADVFEVFTQYGESSKGDSDEVVGYLGIGSKSGFAYGDSFTIVSYTSDCVQTRGHCSLDYVVDDVGVEHQVSSPELRGEFCTIDHPHNHRRSYVAVLDDTERGEIRMMSDEECSPDETGLAIQIPVRPRDIEAFSQKASFLFQFFRPQPVINISLPNPPPMDKDGEKSPGYIVKAARNTSSMPDDHSWLAVMGCIPYKVDLGQLEVAHHVRYMSGILYFKIGDLRVSASREALKYDDHTIAALAAQIEKVVDNYLESTLLQLEKETTWKKRLVLSGLQLFSSIFPKDYATLVGWDAYIKDMGKVLRFKFDRIRIDERSRVVIVNDRRSIKGFHLGDFDYVIRANSREVDETALVQAVDKLLLDLRIDGIPVVKTSDLEWVMEPREIKKNIKHRVKTFEFQPTSGTYLNPYSDYWEPVERVTTSEDVYVILENFKAAAFPFYSRVYLDRRTLAGLGLFPKIYGYRHKHNSDNKYPGVEYSVWSNQVVEMAIKSNPEVAQLVERYRWSQAANFRGSFVIDKNVELLGDQHPILRFLRRIADAKTIINNLDENKRRSIRLLYEREAGLDQEIKKTSEIIHQSYPLLRVYGIDEMVGYRSNEWVEYVRAMDALHESQNSRSRSIQYGQVEGDGFDRQNTCDGWDGSDDH